MIIAAVREGNRRAKERHDWERGRSCEMRLQGHPPWKVSVNVRVLERAWTQAVRERRFISFGSRLAVNPHAVIWMRGW